MPETNASHTQNRGRQLKISDCVLLNHDTHTHTPCTRVLGGSTTVQVICFSAGAWVHFCLAQMPEVGKVAPWGSEREMFASPVEMALKAHGQ